MLVIRRTVEFIRGCVLSSRGMRAIMIRVALAAWSQAASYSITESRHPVWLELSLHQTLEGELRSDNEKRKCVRVCGDRGRQISKSTNPQAENSSDTTYLELGLGMAGAFFPFSPFPSYPFPRAVVLDMLRIAVLFLERGVINGRAVYDGLEAQRAMTSTIGEASAVGAARRARCI